MLHVFCDFDGTITEPDTLCFLTERLGAGPEHYRETGRLLRGGFEEIVELLLRPTGAPVHDVRANRFRPGTWECRFRDDSPHGHDKAAALRSARAEGRRTVLVGDGFSDREPAAVADLVFARRGRSLADWCRTRAIACEEFDTFHDVQRGVVERLGAAG